MSVLIVGSVAFDSIETVDGAVDYALGGSATFSSVAASYFSPVRLVGVVGDDFGREHVRFLESRRIDLTGLERRPGKTFYWKGRYSEGFKERETLITDLNVFEDYEPTLPESYRDAELVFLANIAPDLQHRVLDQATNPKLVVADTMNLWINIQHGELIELIKRVDILILNDEEALQLTDETNLIRAGRAILTYGPSRVIIKKGEHGAVSLTNETYFAAPAYPTAEVKDPTGAGDSFAGAFMGYLAAAGDVSEATVRRGILYGTAVASFTVEGFSLDRLREATRDMVNARYNDLASYLAV